MTGPEEEKSTSLSAECQVETTQIYNQRSIIPQLRDGEQGYMSGQYGMSAEELGERQVGG